METIAEVKPAPAFVEMYPVNEPYAHVGIEQEAAGNFRYVVIEPQLSDDESKLLNQMKDLLKVSLEIDARTFKNDEAASQYMRRQVLRTMKRFDVKVKRLTFEKMMYYLERDLLRLGIIDVLMRDPMIEDISCDGIGIPIYVWQRDYESLPTNLAYPNQETLDKFILRMAYLSGRHMSVAQPLVDASLPDGSRIQMTYGTEVTKKGSTFTIRRFKEDPFSIIDLIRFNTLNSEMAAMIWLALENKLSVLMAGGTASGKTTTINCLSMFIRPESKIVTIEDTPEINLAHKNWIQSVSRPGIGGIGDITLYDLLRAALRQRPDFIIVGEVRGAEAFTLFQAISTGHAGISSIHADAIPAVLRRLVSEPMNIPRNLVTAANIIMLQERITVKGKHVRRISATSEMVGLDNRTNEFIMNELFKYQPASDTFVYSGRAYIVEKISRMRNLSAEEIQKTLANRKAILDWMVTKKIRKYRDVAALIGNYYTDPETVLNQVRIDAY